MYYKKFWIVAILIAVLASSFTIAGTASAADDTICVAFEVQLQNFTGSPATATIFFSSISTGLPLSPTVSLTLQPGASGTLSLFASIPNVPFDLGGGSGGLSITSTTYFGDIVGDSNCSDEAGPLAGNLLDGRLNNEQGKDVAAPVAVYCADGNIDIYKIDAETGDGTRIISVAQVEGSPESTQLLASAEGVSLYWLDTGEYHINTTNFEGKPYWINWVGCSSNDLTHTNN